MRLYSKYFLPLMFLFLVACTDSEKEPANKQDDGIGAETFNMPIAVAPKTVNPRSIIDFYSASVANQIYEGLVRFNPKSLKPEAAIASSYKPSKDLKTFVFTLRDDARFHDSPLFKDGKGRVVDGEDVKKTFEFYCNSKIKGDPIAYLNIFKNTVVGAQEFYNGTSKEISGVQINGNEVSIHLIEPDANFINKMCMVSSVILPREAIEQGKVEDGIGSGPFKLVDLDHKKISFVKNSNYYIKNAAGIQLPIIDSLIFHVIEDREEQLELFRNQKLDIIIGLPTNKLVEVLQQNIKDFVGDPPKYVSIGVPELSTSYLSVNQAKPYLQNKKLRQAISMAIERNEIIIGDLKSQAFIADGSYGMTPPIKRIFKDYDFESIQSKSASFNPEMARKLLAEAGYPNGENLPSLRLEYVESSKNQKVANSILEQLRKNLNINIQIESVSFEQKNKDEKLGKGDLYLSAWLADYASPQSFLSNFYGKLVPENLFDPSPVNSSRYKSDVFDEHYSVACATMDNKARLKHFSEAEKVLMDDAGVIVLWYGEDQKILHSNVRDLQSNAIQLLDFRDVYFKDRVKGEKKANKK